jgi:aryl-alcohol dehydrogenase-like predicted oxidoreductase
MSERLPLRPFGNTGLMVTPLGLAGSFGIDADAVERAYHELGINTFFVTPRMKGLCEGIRRLVAAGHRDQLVLACGASIPTGGSVRRELKNHLRTLGVDHIDVWLLFWVQYHWYVTGRTWPAMARAREEGLVRTIGISIHDRKLAVRITRELDLDVLMIRYNAAHRGAEREIFAELPPERPAVVAYTATRWGKLLKPVKDLPPMTAPECYRFTLGHPRVGLALCGASTYDELCANVQGVLAGPLPADRLAEVTAFGDAVRATARGKIGFLRA